MSALPDRHFAPPWQESIFAVFVFSLCALGVYATRDALTILQLFTLIILGSVLLAALQRPQYGVVGIVVWLAVESVGLKLFPGETFVFIRFFPEVLIYALLGQQLIRRFIQSSEQSDPPRISSQILQQKYAQRLIIFLALFVFVGMISIVWNGDSIIQGFIGIRQIVRFILLGVLMLILPWTLQQRNLFWKAVIVLFICETAIGIAQFLAQGYLDRFLLPSTTIEYGGGFVYASVDQFWQLGTRIFATLGRYDRFGAFMGFLTVIFAAIPLSRLFADFRREYPLSQHVTQLYTVLFIGGVVMVLLSSSRAALVGLVLALLWLLIVVFRKRWILIVSLFIAALLALLSIYYAQIQGIHIRYVVDSPDATLFERLVEPFSEQSLRGNYNNFGRTFWIVEVPRTVVTSSPVFGVGPGRFGSGTVAQFENQAVYNALGLPFGAGGDIGVIDNSWLSLWAEFGTLGLLLFIGILVSLYQYVGAAIHAPQEYSYTRLLLIAGAQASLIFLAVVAFFGNHFEIRTTMMLVWALPILLATWRKTKSRTTV